MKTLIFVSVTLIDKTDPKDPTKRRLPLKPKRQWEIYLKTIWKTIIATVIIKSDLVIFGFIRYFSLRFSLMFVVYRDSFVLFSSIVSDLVITFFIALAWKLFFLQFDLSSAPNAFSSKPCFSQHIGKIKYLY